MAPETLKNERPETGTDMFAFGRLVYRTVTRESPIGKLSKAELVRLAEEGRIPTLDWSRVPESMPFLRPAKVVCEMCVTSKLCDRASAAEVEAFLLQNEPEGEVNSSADERLLSTLQEVLHSRDKRSLHITKKIASL
eukprot:TRINITY_DN10729_c0_g2_i2.p1 TRINITY_DN10729_c0_g2~~TRINITY_DN10729_c0_g2_i2.p1  ORF type:complete len:159 (+),score=24.61 TRINITY_DN10729_c0_g2_i2:69-479(+)